MLHSARLLTAAFNDRDGWEMNALALDGNVYLEDHVTDEAINRK
jgi:RAT1-interacting protein